MESLSVFPSLWYLRHSASSDVKTYVGEQSLVRAVGNSVFKCDADIICLLTRKFGDHNHRFCLSHCIRVYKVNYGQNKSCMQYQTTATEYQTQRNIKRPNGNHTNKTKAVDTGVLPQHHHTADYYHHRGSSDNYDSYEDNCYGYYTDNEVKQDGHSSCEYVDYRNEYYEDYYHGGDYNCYVYYNNYSYDNCGYNHCKYTNNRAIEHNINDWKDVNEDVNTDSNKMIITSNAHNNENNFRA